MAQPLELPPKDLAREAEARRFLEAPPPGTASLRLLRFRRLSLSHVASRVVDDLLGAGESSESPKAPPGIAFVFLDEAESQLSTFDLHPIAHGAESRLLPDCIDVVQTHGLTFHLLLTDERTRPAAPGLFETHEGTALLGKAVSAGGYRHGPETLPSAALDRIADSGADVSMQDCGLRIRAEHRIPRNAWWLLMLPPMLIFFPFLVLFRQIGFRDFLGSVGGLLRSAFRGEHWVLQYVIEPGHIEVGRSQLGHEEPVRIALRDIRYVSFAPGGHEVTSQSIGQLRVLADRTAHPLPFLPKPPSLKDPEAIARARDLGRAYKSLLQAAARRARR